MKTYLIALLIIISLLYSGDAIANPEAENNNLADSTDLPTNVNINMVKKAIDYLSGFSTMAAEFTQVGGANSLISEGYFFISRPGKARWEYYSPTPLIIIVNDGKLVHYDSLLDQITYTSAPNDTLSQLLEKNVDMLKTFRILNIRNEEITFAMTLELKENPTLDSDSLSLVFLKEPFKLVRMHKIDSSNHGIVINLSQLVFDKELEEHLYIFENPRLLNSKKKN